MELFDEIKKMIIKIFALDNEMVVPDAHLQDDLGADSLALVTLSEEISERYSIELDLDDLVDIENVAELVKLVESKIRD